MVFEKIILHVKFPLKIIKFRGNFVAKLIAKSMSCNLYVFAKKGAL